MIEELVDYTRLDRKSNNLYDINKIKKVDLKTEDFYKLLDQRQSFRLFSNNAKKSNLKFIKSLYNFLTEISNELLYEPNFLKLCFLDSSKVLDNEEKLYIFNSNNFLEIKTYKSIEKENLFLQSEIHDSTGTLMFLWDNNVLENYIDKQPYLYRDILLFSGYLGYIASLFGTQNEIKGTVFAGAIQNEWELLVKHPKYTPIFAYAFETF